MGPTDILQPEQRVESLKLIYCYYMLHSSDIMCNKITGYPPNDDSSNSIISKFGISTTF